MNADIVPLDSLEFDQANTNRHTPRGQEMTRRSVDVFDPRQPLELDKNGVIINGNDRASYYQERGIKEVKVVDVEPGEVLAVRYPDFDLSDPDNPAREYQIAQAKSAQVSLDFDPAAIELNLEAGMDLGDWFKPYELDLLIGNVPAGIDPNEEWQGMPGFENEAVDVYKTIKVHFKTEEDYHQFALLIDQPLTEKTISIYHPRQMNENLKLYRAVDES